MIAAMPCLFSEYPAPLPVCFPSEIPDCRPLRETSAMRQGAESLTCFCGAGVAKLLSGEAKSNATPNAVFMVKPSSASRRDRPVPYLLKCNSVLNWLTRGNKLGLGACSPGSPGGG